MSHYDLETKCLHSGYTPKKGEPCALPIYQSTTFKNMIQPMKWDSYLI